MAVSQLAALAQALLTVALTVALALAIALALAVALAIAIVPFILPVGSAGAEVAVVQTVDAVAVFALSALCC